MTELDKALARNALLLDALKAIYPYRSHEPYCEWLVNGSFSCTCGMAEASKTVRDAINQTTPSPNPIQFTRGSNEYA